MDNKYNYLIANLAWNDPSQRPKNQCPEATPHLSLFRPIRHKAIRSTDTYYYASVCVQIKDWLLLIALNRLPKSTCLPHARYCVII